MLCVEVCTGKIKVLEAWTSTNIIRGSCWCWYRITAIIATSQVRVSQAGGVACCKTILVERSIEYLASRDAVGGPPSKSFALKDGIKLDTLLVTCVHRIDVVEDKAGLISHGARFAACVALLWRFKGRQICRATGLDRRWRRLVTNEAAVEIVVLDATAVRWFESLFAQALVVRRAVEVKGVKRKSYASRRIDACSITV